MKFNELIEQYMGEVKSSKKDKIKKQIQDIKDKIDKGKIRSEDGVEKIKELEAKMDTIKEASEEYHECPTCGQDYDNEEDAENCCLDELFKNDDTWRKEYYNNIIKAYKIMGNDDYKEEGKIYTIKRLQKLSDYDLRGLWDTVKSMLNDYWENYEGGDYDERQASKKWKETEGI
jgi:hypothetical protein